MGLYLNSKKPALLYKNEAQAAYFIDKSSLLDELAALLEQPDTDSEPTGTIGSRYICITKPRRFGKTVMANMIAAYFGRGADTSNTFDRLTVSQRKWYKKHLNKHNVILIMFNEMPAECRNYSQYITRIQQKLLGDLMREFPDADIEDGTAVWDALNRD